MIVSDVITRVRRKFGDEAGVQIDDADVIRWINDAQRDVVMKNETVLQTTSLANAVANQQDYTLPTNLLVLRGVHFKLTGNPSYYRLEGMSFNEFDEQINGWEGTLYGPSVPTVYTTYGGAIKVFPIPVSSGTNNFKLYYSRQPVDVTTSASSIDLPLAYHNGIVDYCMAQAYELDEDWNAASNSNATYDNRVRLNKEREEWGNHEVYPRITVDMEDLW